MTGQNQNLLYLINSLHVGGAEVGMCRLLNGLDSDDFDVTVVALDGHSEALINRLPPWVSVLDLQVSDYQSSMDLLELFRLVRSADIIVGSLFHASMIARIAGLLNPGATIATWRHSTTFKTDLRKSLSIRSAGLSDVILADSDPVAELLIDDLGINEEKVWTVPIAGIDLSKYTPVTHQESREISIGVIGRLTEAKNMSMVLRVAERLPESRFSFEIAGDGELYDDLLDEIEDRGLTNVTLHGRVDDVPAFLSQLDIYFQPSLWEGLCITVLEAMAAGLPIVGSDVGGIGRNVVHGENGFLYDTSDVDGFTSGIQSLAKDHQRRSEFGSNSRQIVVNQFTQDVLVARFLTAVIDN